MHEITGVSRVHPASIRQVNTNYRLQNSTSKSFETQKDKNQKSERFFGQFLQFRRGKEETTTINAKTKLLQESADV